MKLVETYPWTTRSQKWENTSVTISVTAPVHLFLCVWALMFLYFQSSNWQKYLPQLCYRGSGGSQRHASFQNLVKWRKTIGSRICKKLQKKKKRERERKRELWRFWKRKSAKKKNLLRALPLPLPGCVFAKLPSSSRVKKRWIQQICHLQMFILLLIFDVCRCQAENAFSDLKKACGPVVLSYRPEENGLHVMVNIFVALCSDFLGLPLFVSFSVVSLSIQLCYQRKKFARAFVFIFSQLISLLSSVPPCWETVTSVIYGKNVCWSWELTKPPKNWRWVGSVRCSNRLMCLGNVDKLFVSRLLHVHRGFAPQCCKDMEIWLASPFCRR